MTRLASIAGAAAVAAMLVLSGCPTAVRVDLAKRLVGTWETESIPGMQEIPAALQADGLPTSTDVMRSVTAVVADDEGHHKGTVTITVTSTPTDAMVAAALMAATQQSAIVTTATGTIYVRSTTEMQVTITSIANTPAAFVVPEQLVTDFEDVPLPATYELADDVLMVNSAILTALGVVAPGEALTLTR